MLKYEDIEKMHRREKMEREKHSRNCTGRQPISRKAVRISPPALSRNRLGRIGGYLPEHIYTRENDAAAHALWRSAQLRAARDRDHKRISWS